VPLPADLIGTVRYGGKGCLALDGKKVMYLSRRRRLGILLVDFGNDAMALAAPKPGLRGACDEMYERREDPFSSLERSARSARYRLDRHDDPQAGFGAFITTALFHGSDHFACMRNLLVAVQFEVHAG